MGHWPELTKRPVFCWGAAAMLIWASLLHLHTSSGIAQCFVCCLAFGQPHSDTTCRVRAFLWHTVVAWLRKCCSAGCTGVAWWSDGRGGLGKRRAGVVWRLAPRESMTWHDPTQLFAPIWAPLVLNGYMKTPITMFIEVEDCTGAGASSR